MLSVATDRADRCTTHCPIGQSEALLDLVFSPREPKESEEDQAEYEETKAEFDTLCERANLIYKVHEERAEQRMWRAIQQLPEDLYNEAVASKPEKVPEEHLGRMGL
eukprot:g20967.t1